MSLSFNPKSGYCYDHFLKNTSNMISNGLFQRIFGHSFKEISHCFICCKSLCNRENIILQCNQGSGGNLRSKVAGCNGSVHGNILFRCSRYASRFWDSPYHPRSDRRYCSRFTDKRMRMMGHLSFVIVKPCND